VTHGVQQLAAIVRDLDTAQVPLDDLALRRPTLDDVFLALTGHAASELQAASQTETAQSLVRSR
jgi:ABC-2 type transport system ATP-binding protein